MITFYTYTQSPIGTLLLTSNGVALTRLWMLDQMDDVDIKSDWIEKYDAHPFPDALRQLCDYFNRTLIDFDLPLTLTGTDFQTTVWNYLRSIPYGSTISYGQLAAAIGQPTASRAVGLANGSNPIGIIVPCHRVIGANGKLTGYAGGLHRKQKLLQLEKDTIAKMGLCPQLSLL